MLLTTQVLHEDYETFYIKHTLCDVGHRILELSLFSIQNANITCIITLCSYLEILIFYSYLIEPLDVNVVVDPDTPHLIAC
jgi:hypothetical protein